jgi:hypothetical protein
MHDILAPSATKKQTIIAAKTMYAMTSLVSIVATLQRPLEELARLSDHSGRAPALEMARIRALRRLASLA